MDKNDLLKHIAETAYNVGYGAKKHFATYDIVDKAPGLISFISMAVGVFALYIDSLSTKSLSATFIVLGVAGLYMTFYDSKKQNYADAGVQLTQLFNELKTLYETVKSAPDNDLQKLQVKLSDIENRFYPVCISKQILLSDWYAHYKFFWQHQIDWVDEQKHFKLFRDKLPLTFTISVALVLISLSFWGLDLVEKFCNTSVP